MQRRQYWFTILGPWKEVGWWLEILIEKNFKITPRAAGGGYYGKVHRDYFVWSKEKRNQIKKFIKLNYPKVSFISYS